MATVAGQATKVGDERRFFFYMAVAIFITAVVGFGSDIVVRHVWFTDFPWPVHIHAAIFVSQMAAISLCTASLVGSAQGLQH